MAIYTSLREQIFPVLLFLGVFLDGDLFGFFECFMLMLQGFEG